MAFIVSDAQYVVSGYVYDQQTHEPLAFVNIVNASGNAGTSTNIEGKFTLESSSPVTQIRLSSVGYLPLVAEVKSNDIQKIYLHREDIELGELVVLPGINPADIIMEKVYENRNQNNPEKNCSFRYENYNKFFVTLALDSSLINSPEKIAKLDSSSLEALSFFEQQYMFLSESVTERKFIPPDKNLETVLASKVSGFENPVFNLLATQFQSFTFYSDFITIGPVQYEGPIAKNSDRRYFFLIEDTLINGADSVFVISFRPKKGQAFKAMKGTLYVNLNGYALQNVIAEPNDAGTEAIRIKIQQKYEKIEGKQWFPSELNTVMDFSKTVKIENFRVLGYSYGYLKNIQPDPGLSKKDFSAIEVKMDEQAGKQSEDFWNKNRNDSLTGKEKKTYHVIDSLGKVAKLDKKMNAVGYLLSGRIPIGVFSLDLDKILNYNEYEGFRLGAGLHTSKKVSKYFELGGYGAYGFSDQAFKYGGDATIFISPKHQAQLQFIYKNDVLESGKTFFPGADPFLFSNDLSSFFANRFDKMEKMEVVFSSRAFKHFKFFLSANTQFRKSFEEYQFAVPLDESVTLLNSEYKITEFGFTARFQYREKFTETPFGLISNGSDFPVVWLKLSQGMKTIFDGEQDYVKLDMRIEKRHRMKRMGFFGYRIDAGKVFGEVPYGILYNGKGTYRPFNIYAGQSFETMRINEFLSDEYMAAFLKYEIGSLFFKKKFRPQFVLATNACIGKLSDSGSHRNITFSTLEDGYIESGLMINNLIKFNYSTFGISGFYRYGANRLPDEKENWVVKFVLGYAL